jgi:hypothetical protein
MFIGLIEEEPGSQSRASDERSSHMVFEVLLFNPTVAEVDSADSAKIA